MDEIRYEQNDGGVKDGFARPMKVNPNPENLDSKASKASSSRTAFVVCCVVIIILGVGLLGIGIWFKVDKYVVSYFMIMRKSGHDETLLAAAALAIVAGILTIVTGSLGIEGVSRNSRILMFLFLLITFVVIILELVIGFSVVAFNDQVHKSLKNGMKQQLREKYQFDSSEGKAWNYVQVRLACCGADSSYDYVASEWWYGANPGASADSPQQARQFVPTTCCQLISNEEADRRRVDPQNPHPKDPQKCQEAARGRQDSRSSYINGRGCYAAVLRKFSQRGHLVILMVFGCCVAFLQMFVFLLGLHIYRDIGHRQHERY